MAAMNQYEGMFLLGPTISQNLEDGLKLVRGMIEKHGGEIIVLKKWDERKLAYEINKQKRGVYAIAYFRAAGSAVAPLERDVKLSEDLLRVMITDANHLDEKEMNAVEPQPIVPREERPSWDDRPPRREYGDKPSGDRGGDRGGDRPVGGAGGGSVGGGAGSGDRPPRARREENAPAEAGAAAKD